jgi:pimeloyl-ACP methyl ester carboxylesterase
MVARMPHPTAPPARGRLAVHWSGRSDPGAPTLVLLHGLTDSGECWPDAVRRWQDDYRIAAPDARGHGASPRYTPEELEDDPIELMYRDTVEVVSEITRGGADPVVLVGHSMGGGIAAAVAARHPDLVRAAVLEDPAWFEKVSWEDRHESAVQRVATSQQFRDDYATAMDQGRAVNARWPASELDPWGRAKADGDLGFLATGLAFLDTPWTTIAAGISVPTLVVTGTDDVILDAGTRQAIEDLGNPHLQVAVVADAGHCVRREQPEAYHALVDPWLAAHVR